MHIQISHDLVEAAGRSEGETGGWTLAKRKAAYQRYIKFLQLIAEDPGRDVAPTRDIDAMWHLHMQAPRAYYKDCLALCGDIIDHDGGFGHSDEERPQLVAVFEDTAQRWQAKYGEDYTGSSGTESATKCWHNCVSRCHNACKTDTMHP